MDLFRLPPSLCSAVLSSTSCQTTIRRLLATSAGPGHDVLSSPSLRSSALANPPPLPLNNYSVSIPPNKAQLKYAHIFFSSNPPTLLFSAAHFRSLPPSPHPEVAFLGRSNVGKSSLLNALFGRTSVQDARVSKRPGRTRTMNGFGVRGPHLLGAAPKEGEREGLWKRFPRGGVVVVDMPGYGGGSQEEWGAEALKFLEHRKQLRRTFVLVDAEHGLKGSDVQLLTHLRRLGVAHQVILSKVDKVIYPGAKPPSPQRLANGLLQLRELGGSIRHRLNQESGDSRDHLGDILCCSAEKSLDDRSRHRKLGIDAVRWAVLSACGVECDEMGQSSTARLQDIHVLEETEG